VKWRFVEPQDYEWAIAASKEHHKESDWSEVEYNDVKAKKVTKELDLWLVE